MTMATRRQNVPLRDTAGLPDVADGTMCRMPSPLPGPLRLGNGRELTDLRDVVDDKLLADEKTPAASHSLQAAGKRVVPIIVGRVA